MRAALVSGMSDFECNQFTALQIACLPYDLPLSPFEGIWWGLFERADLVGFASLHLDDSDTGYLSRAGVLPDYRGRQGQRKLIKAREAKARELGLGWITSDTFDNPASANNLIACGFRMYASEDPRPGACYWRKALP